MTGTIVMAALAFGILLAAQHGRPEAADCAASFPAFVERFESDQAFQRGHVRYPLDETFLEQQKNGDWNTVTERIAARDRNTASVPLMPSPAVQREHGLQKNIVDDDTGGKTVHLSAPASDAYIRNFHFARQGRCWSLTAIEDRSLVERVPPVMTPSYDPL